MMRTQQQRSAARKKQDKSDYKACMEREDSTCQKCGARAVHMHHARTKRVDLRHDPRHHVCVCYKCHVWFHAHPKAGREWLEGRGMWDATCKECSKETDIEFNRLCADCITIMEQIEIDKLNTGD